MSWKQNAISFEYPVFLKDTFDKQFMDFINFYTNTLIKEAGIITFDNLCINFDQISNGQPKDIERLKSFKCFSFKKNNKLRIQIPTLDNTLDQKLILNDFDHFFILIVDFKGYLKKEKVITKFKSVPVYLIENSFFNIITQENFIKEKTFLYSRNKFSLILFLKFDFLNFNKVYIFSIILNQDE